MNTTATMRMVKRRLLAGVCLLVLAFVAALSIFGNRPMPPPKVTATFSTVTNANSGPVAVFNLTNESDLIVHVFAEQIGGVFVPCNLVTIPPRESAVLSATILPPTDNTGLTTNRVSLSSPISVEFYLRRQDTHFEEARELLDSVLQSVRIVVPGLNPDSSRNLFQIRSTIPAQD